MQAPAGPGLTHVAFGKLKLTQSSSEMHEQKPTLLFSPPAWQERPPVHSFPDALQGFPETI